MAIDFGGPRAGAAGLVRQLDGKLVVGGVTEVGAGGEETRDYAIVRLLPDGSIDHGFNSVGTNVIDMGMGQLDGPMGFDIQPDGDLVIVGYTRTVVEGTASEDFAVARFVGDTGTATAIFLDGFESGDTSAWSDTVGGL